MLLVASLIFVSYVQSTTVCVVGGGASGLAAQAALAKSPKIKNIYLIEAQDELGGRTKTRYTPSGAAFDLGAQWVHGVSNTHPLVPIARRLGVTIIRDTNDEYFYNKATFERYSPQEMKLMQADFNKVMDVVAGYQDSFENDAPLSVGIDQAYDEVKSSLQSAMRTDKSILLALVRYHIEDEYAADTRRQSLYYWDMDTLIRGGDGLVPIGMGTLVQRAFPISSKTTVFLNHKVTLIENQGSKIRIVTTPREFQCNNVIVTASIGVLNAGSITFRPSSLIPTLTRQAWNHRGLGQVDKFMMEFPRKWWPGDAGEYFIMDTRRNFTTLFDLSRVNGKPMLAVLVQGDANLKAFAAFSDDKMFELILAEIRSMFPRIDVPNPVFTQAARWTKDPLVLGAWSYNKVGIEFNKDFTNIRLSSSPRLTFAGEHTHKQYFSTVAGAILSGQREAKYVLSVV